jgi:hypothetical protein
MTFGLSEAMLLGHRGFARSLAGLMQLALVFVPLMAIVPAATAIAGEREVGTLDYLLAQPLTRHQVFFGKWAGVVAATVLSVVVGFGLTGAVAAARGVPSGLVAGLLGLTILLAVTFVSLGVWVSAHSGSRTRATSVSLTVWLVFTGLGSLGVMSAFVRWGLPPATLQAWSIVNPVEAYRLATLVVLDPQVDVLGAVGQSLVDRLGRVGVVSIATASLVGWTGITLWVGLRSFATSDTVGFRQRWSRVG